MSDRAFVAALVAVTRDLLQKGRISPEEILSNGGLFMTPVEVINPPRFDGDIYVRARRYVCRGDQILAEITHSPALWQGAMYVTFSRLKWVGEYPRSSQDPERHLFDPIVVEGGFVQAYEAAVDRITSITSWRLKRQLDRARDLTQRPPNRAQVADRKTALAQVVAAEQLLSQLRTLLGA